jgi:hypothetical protein
MARNLVANLICRVVGPQIVVPQYAAPQQTGLRSKPVRTSLVTCLRISSAHCSKFKFPGVDPFYTGRIIAVGEAGLVWRHLDLDALIIQGHGMNTDTKMRMEQPQVAYENGFIGRKKRLALNSSFTK